MQGRGRGKQLGTTVTPVESALNPEITSDRIVVPATAPEKAAFDGDGRSRGNGHGVGHEVGSTGIIAMDAVDDYGYDHEIDIKLGADGSKSGSSKSNQARNIVIGVGIGLVAIYAIRKFKLIK